MSKKKTVNIRYCLGFERLVRAEIKNFEKLGLKPTIYRAAVNTINKRLNIKVGYYGDKEIDFIGEKNGEKLYIQVALKIDSDKTAEREFGNLLKIQDNYPKIVVTEDTFSGNSYEGIRHCPIRQFSME